MNIHTAFLRLVFLASTSCVTWMFLEQILLMKRSAASPAAASSVAIAVLATYLLIRAGLLVSPKVGPAAIFKAFIKSLFASLAKLLSLVAVVFVIALLAGKSPPKDAVRLGAIIAIFIAIPLAMPFAIVATGRKLMTSAQNVSSEAEYIKQK